MKAVNLIPPEERGGADRTGGAVYVLLGGLGLLVVLAAVWVLTNNQITENQAQLEQLRADTTAAQQEAAALAPFRQFASLRTKRVETVRSLANSRFDWGPVLRKLAMVLPRDTYLTSMVGTVRNGVSLEGGGSGGDTAAVRGKLDVPAVELVGCARSQAEVARVMARLRLIDGVQQVSLASSKKPDAGSGGGQNDPSAGGSGATEDCRGGRVTVPQFSIVVFFHPAGTASGTTAPAPGGSAPPAPAPGGSASTPPPAGGAAPASSPSGGTQ